MTELVEIPAMEPFPRALPSITSPRELLMHLRSGASLAQIDPPENADAAAEPTYRLVVRGQETFRVSSRPARGFIGYGTVSEIGKDSQGRLLYVINAKGRT